MAAIRRRFNYKNIILDDMPNSEGAMVRLRDGRYKRMPWGGFISLSEAKALPGAQPVKLEAEEYKAEPSIFGDWQRVPEGKHIQGCRVGHLVYGVQVDGVPRVI